MGEKFLSVSIRISHFLVSEVIQLESESGTLGIIRFSSDSDALGLCRRIELYLKSFSYPLNILPNGFLIELNLGVSAKSSY